MALKPEFLDARTTERRNPRTTDIDQASSLEIVDLLNAEDRRVPEAVHAEREHLARAIDLATRAIEAGGRLIYVGAGTSGRLGVLDAAECPPTFGTPPEMVVGVIAGGRAALTGSQEGAEDDTAAAEHAMAENGVDVKDFVLGIAASGTTPFVSAALKRARALGAVTGLVTCAAPPEDLELDVVIAVRTGPEALTGSTRLKAGTATKLVLNCISTGTMIRRGKAYGNLMVDLKAWSDKLVDRSERIVMEATGGGAGREEARRAIKAAGGSVKLAIVMVSRSVSAAEGERLLTDAGGVVRAVVGDPPSVIE